MLETMELVRANEVHLARKSGLVTLGSEVVRVGRNFGCKDGSIIVASNLRWKLPRAHGETRRCTEWRVAVGAGEYYTSLCELVEIGRLDDRVWVVHLEKRRSHLVSHNVQDVWLLRRVLVRA